MPRAQRGDSSKTVSSEISLPVVAKSALGKQVALEINTAHRSGVVSIFANFFKMAALPT
jgi:hypothetical protein